MATVQVGDIVRFKDQSRAPKGHIWWLVSDLSFPETHELMLDSLDGTRISEPAWDDEVHLVTES